MGDRNWWNEDCPNCKGVKTVEVYDAPSCLQFSRKCQKCNWTDGLCYFEAPDNVIELMTKKEAEKKGLIFNCPKCQDNMMWWEKQKYKMCIICYQKINDNNKIY